MQRGPRGSALWQATPGPEGGLRLHPACRDALLVGRPGSSAPHPPSSHQPPPSSSPQHCPSKRVCSRASQKLWHQSRGCTLHMKPYTQLMVANVFSKKSQVSCTNRRVKLLDVHICTHTHIAHKWGQFVLQNIIGNLNRLHAFFNIGLFLYLGLWDRKNSLFKLSSVRSHKFYHHRYDRTLTVYYMMTKKSTSRPSSLQGIAFRNYRWLVALTDTSHRLQWPLALFLSLPQRKCIPFQGSDP